MTPQEKAKELLDKFKINDYDWILMGNDSGSKQSALFTVDEILNTIYNEDFDGHLIDEIDAATYWNKVKSELKK